MYFESIWLHIPARHLSCDSKRFSYFSFAYLWQGLWTGRMKGLLARAIVVIDESGKIMCTEPVHGKAQESDYEAALARISHSRPLWGSGFTSAPFLSAFSFTGSSRSAFLPKTFLKASRTLAIDTIGVMAR